MATFEFHLHAAGALAPGIESLTQLRAVASGAAPYLCAPLPLAAPAMLPPQERRRASQAVRLVLACVDQALQSSPFPAESLRSVFASDEGTGEVCQQMLEALATTRQVSPLLFSNSVLSAPSGYVSIAWRSRAPATVVSLGLESFASGLMCAVTEARACQVPVLLVVYDPPMTAPLDELLPVRDAIASAWIIACGECIAPTLGSLEITLGPALQDACALPSWMPPQWAHQASARGLAALSLLDADVGTALRLRMGAQMLTLRRTAGPTA